TGIYAQGGLGPPWIPHSFERAAPGQSLSARPATQGTGTVKPNQALNPALWLSLRPAPIVRTSASGHRHLRRPQLNVRSSTPAAQPPQLNTRSSTPAAQHPQLNTRSSTPAA